MNYQSLFFVRTPCQPTYLFYHPNQTTSLLFSICWSFFLKNRPVTHFCVVSYQLRTTVLANTRQKHFLLGTLLHLFRSLHLSLSVSFSLIPQAESEWKGEGPDRGGHPQLFQTLCSERVGHLDFRRDRGEIFPFLPHAIYIQKAPEYTCPVVK